jgi:hypothetical protein
MDHYDFTNENYPIYDNFKLSSKKINQLNELVKYDTLKYSKSQVLNTKTKENETNENIRKSERAVTKNKKVFDWLDENIIGELNSKHTKNKFHIVRDELDVIKYAKNDYFAAHQDFVKFHCKYLKCATILICLHADCEGGITKLYFPDDEKNIKETKTTGGCLMLRNEVYHSGEKLKSGTKIILKVNIFITPLHIYDQKIVNDNFIVIGFNKDNRIFIIPNNIVDKFKNSFITLCKSDVIIPMHEKIIVDVEYDAFEKVYEILFDPKKRLDASRETINLLDKYGFVDNMMYLVDELMHKKKMSEMQKINDFIENKQLAYLTQNVGDYETFKKIFCEHEHIIPISIIFDKDKLVSMNVYNGIPIYYTGLNNSEFYWFHEHSDVQNMNDINVIRRKMLFTDQDVEIEGIESEDESSAGSCTESGSHEDDSNSDSSAGHVVVSKKEDKMNKLKIQAQKRRDILESYAPINIYSANEYDYVQANITFLATLNDLTHQGEGYNESANKINKQMNQNMTKYDVFKISKEINAMLPVIKKKYFGEYVSKKIFDDTKIVRPITSSVAIKAYHCNESNYADIQIELYFGFINLKFKKRNKTK